MSTILAAQRAAVPITALAGSLVLLRVESANGADVRVQVIEVGDPDPDYPDRTVYRDRGTQFVARWWELGEQLTTALERETFLAGRLVLIGTAVFMLEPTELELEVCQRAHAGWSHDAALAAARAEEVADAS